MIKDIDFGVRLDRPEFKFYLYHCISSCCITNNPKFDNLKEEAFV